ASKIILVPCTNCMPSGKAILRTLWSFGRSITLIERTFCPDSIRAAELVRQTGRTPPAGSGTHTLIQGPYLSATFVSAGAAAAEVIEIRIKAKINATTLLAMELSPLKNKLASILAKVLGSVN